MNIFERIRELYEITGVNTDTHVVMPNLIRTMENLGRQDIDVFVCLLVGFVANTMHKAEKSGDYITFDDEEKYGELARSKPWIDLERVIEDWSVISNRHIYYLAGMADSLGFLDVLPDYGDESGFYVSLDDEAFNMENY